MRRVHALERQLRAGCAPPAAARPAAATDAGDQPLSGVRVVDATQMISGPMCCCLLADQGADVIKVEPPEGDSMRALAKGWSPTFTTTNRNKRSLAVDAKKPEGLELILQLLGTADVFVQNFRPGAAERMGLGYDAVRKVRPDIVYVSISGFGKEGPYSAKRVYDPVIQAVSGLASVQADTSGRPRMVRVIVPDKVTAITAAQAVSSALYRRAKTGKGAHIRMSMLDSVVSFLWPEAMAGYTFTGKNKTPVARGGLLGAHDMIYRCRDGKYMTCGTLTMKEFRGLCLAFDKPEWLRDPRFQDAAGLTRHRDQRLEMIDAVLAGMDRDAALAALDRNQVPCGPVHHPRAEILTDPQLQLNETVVTAEHPHAGAMRFARPAARWDGEPEWALRRHAPLIGEHNREVMREIGVPASRIDDLCARGVLRAKPGLH